MPLLPIVVKLEGRRCVVVGGGPVAERKTSALLQALAQSPGMKIALVSPTATDRLKQWAHEALIEWLPREYEENDTLGAALVFAATGSPEVNRRVIQDAERAGILVNAADDPDKSSFYLPAVVRRGRLLLAVSTAGASPSAAMRIRDELEQRYGLVYEVWLDTLAEARLLIRRRVGDTRLRQELHRRLERWDAPRLVGEGRLPPGGYPEALLAALEREPLLEPEALTRLLEELEESFAQNGGGAGIPPR